MDRLEEIKRILRGSETEDIEPPYSCLPEQHEKWIEFKAHRICSLFPKPELCYSSLMPNFTDSHTYIVFS